MTRLATIELEDPTTGQGGRVFLDRELLYTTTVEALEQEFVGAFVEPDDEPRMALLQQLFSRNESVLITVHPGENKPPEYHAFLKDPGNPNVPIFACVLAPMPVIVELVGRAPHVVFETAAFQAMAAETEPARMLAALEAWARRVWPTLRLPRFELSPWPVEEIAATPIPMPLVAARRAPIGAPAFLDRSDYPTPEECA